MGDKDERGAEALPRNKVTVRLEVDTDEAETKLERIKTLLAEIKELSDGLFGKQQKEVADLRVASQPGIDADSLAKAITRRMNEQLSRNYIPFSDCETGGQE